MSLSSSVTQSDIVVIGAGAIGLACAWRLAQGGARVSLLDRVQAGREASFAAGGMLAPTCERLLHPLSTDDLANEAISQMCRESRDMYPALVSELQNATGRDVELSLGNHGTPDWREPGILLVSTQHNPALETHPLPRQHNGFPACWLEDEGQIDNRKLVDALRKVCLERGVWLRDNSLVRGFEIKNNRITALLTPSGPQPVQRVLICAGAWSNKFTGLPDEAMLPVKPLAGEMLQLRSERRLKHIIYSENCYLIPRRDGRLLVGATSEDVGFNKRVTASGVWELLSAARELEPALSDAPFESQWAGLRPLTPDGLPVIGQGPIENLFYATGHGRNGILLTPKTAQIAADMMLNNKSAPEFLRLNRFNKAEPTA